MHAIREDDYTKHKVCVHVELTEEEYRDFMDMRGEASLSEAARYIVDKYDKACEHKPHTIAFWIPRERHVELQANARKKGKKFQSYLRILFTDFFRERAKA